MVSVAARMVIPSRRGAAGLLLRVLGSCFEWDAGNEWRRLHAAGCHGDWTGTRAAAAKAVDKIRLTIYPVFAIVLAMRVTSAVDPGLCRRARSGLKVQGSWSGRNVGVERIRKKFRAANFCALYYTPKAAHDRRDHGGDGIRNRQLNVLPRRVIAPKITRGHCVDASEKKDIACGIA
ncbi:hypothetical protein EVAR_63357_1 [Eumeta japonica]|uniref:Uncharacterized protein n=1 Tax=Eumeta variegata TaxID=151549 RepID=A0A4C2AC13_EUMVA|nr:hypothetical protein EVAR_63357_1 [Eumeta japonica]